VQVIDQREQREDLNNDIPTNRSKAQCLASHSD
jgi:hypothetical protein